MTNNTELQRAIKTMSKPIYSHPHEIKVTKAAQNYADFPSKIEGMKVLSRGKEYFYTEDYLCDKINDKLDDVLKLLEVE